MSTLSKVKRLRKGVNLINELLYGCMCLAVGSLISIFIGRIKPITISEDSYRDSLIICPSPMLNKQRINKALREKYVISFVNRACLSPVFEELKPERYFLVDPGFFQDDWADNKSVEPTISRIKVFSSWKMIIVVPWHYRNSSVVKELKKNKNLSTVYIPVFELLVRNNKMNSFGLKHGLISPIYRNVLIAAIYYSLKVGHKKTIVWGAHHTWLKEVSVNTRNVVLHSVRHTEEERVDIPLLNSDGTGKLYHSYLYQLATVFEQYHLLNAFAKDNKQIILNATSDSYIDAFPRLKEIDIFKENY